MELSIKNIIRDSSISALALISVLSIGGMSSANASSITTVYHVNRHINRHVRHHARRHHSHRSSNVVNRMTSIAKSKAGAPYVLGASGPSKFDCSGFTKYVYAHGAHKYIPRTAQSQYDYGQHISGHQAKAGDLVFFGSSRSNISHVGMCLGHGKMIDSQLRGVVTEDIHAPWWNAVGYARI